MNYKLYIPGPVNISRATYKAMTRPIMSHRSYDFIQLYQRIQPGLQLLFGTKNDVYLSTSSAWGAMEGAVKNCSKKKILNCMGGAFSDKWNNVSMRCGKKLGKLQVSWGKAIMPKAIDHELSKGEYDAITLVHNETSTSVMNPLPDIMKVVKKYPEIISIVDVVSSYSGIALEMDFWGVDVMIASTQKALALPPGLSLLAVSQNAINRAKTIKNRGYYFDFLEFSKNHQLGMTLSTPAIPLLHALDEKLQEINNEGLGNRYKRHNDLNNKVHNWVKRNKFEMFPEEKYASKTLTCIRNNKNINLSKMNEALKKRYGCIIDEGYGKIKGKTFRISNMGNETEKTIDILLSNLDSLLPEFTQK